MYGFRFLLNLYPIFIILLSKRYERGLSSHIETTLNDCAKEEDMHAPPMKGLVYLLVLAVLGYTSR